MDEFFVPSLLTSSLWSLVGTMVVGTTTDRIRRFTIRYTQNSSESRGDDSNRSLPLLDGRSLFAYLETLQILPPSTTDLPSLDSIHNETGKLVKGADVSWLLDFAIVEFRENVGHRLYVCDDVL
jgi:hypothetical protein